MSSENVTSGENQQETASARLDLDSQWVVGFVDGEGLFLRIDTSQPVCSADERVATPSGVSRLPTFEPSKYLQDPQRLHARHRAFWNGEDIVRPAWRHAELDRNVLARRAGTLPER